MLLGACNKSVRRDVSFGVFVKLNDPVRRSEIEKPVMPVHISYVEPFWEAQSSVGEVVGMFVGAAVGANVGLFVGGFMPTG
jgi:hypothetical protein